MFGLPKKRGIPFVHDTLAREYGVICLQELWNGKGGSKHSQPLDLILHDQNTDHVFDVIEAVFAHCAAAEGQWAIPPRVTPIAAAVEINERFKEHNVGYQLVDGKVVRTDSLLLHEEVVSGATALLRQPAFAGPNEEFLAALEHYRHGRYKECLNECLKALESTLKIVCDQKGWPYPANATARTLVARCFENGLVPDFLQSQFASLRATLESGVPTARNRLAGHGQGSTSVEVPPYLAKYVLYLTGASVILLVDAATA